MGVLQDLLPTMFQVRGLLDTDIGARPYSVTVVKEQRSNNWSGNAPIVTSQKLISEANGGNPKVRITSQADYLRGAPGDSDLTVGPITPPYSGGGTDFDDLESTLSGEIVYYVVNGPGLENVRYVKAGFNGESVLGYLVFLKRASQE